MNPSATNGTPCLRCRDPPTQARFLEEFLKQFVFELNGKDALVNFLDTRLPYTVEI